MVFSKGYLSLLVGFLGEKGGNYFLGERIVRTREKLAHSGFFVLFLNHSNLIYVIDLFGFLFIWTMDRNQFVDDCICIL